jgi:CSLREA domain-containing protein
MALLLVPGAAAANTITVNSTADTAVDDGACTLREAILASDNSAKSGNMAGECDGGDSSADVIQFAASILGGTIGLGSPAEAILGGTDIAGGTCMTAAGVNGPCVRIDGPSGSAALIVGSSGVSISGVAVTGASIGIKVNDGVQGFQATNDWLGVALNGAAGSNGVGLLLDPNSSGARIGDGTAAGRNVIAFNSGRGLDIQGSDDNTVQGNYFGVAPNGTKIPSPQFTSPMNIKITGTTGGGDSTGNLIGGTVSQAQADSAVCEGPCNVIAAASTSGISLDGSGVTESPAGRTTIRGNLVGFDATGLVEAPSNLAGIDIGNADDVTIGGSSQLDANHVAGSKDSVVSSAGAHNMLVQHNVIGLNYAGTDEATSPVPSGSHGVLVQTYAGGDATVVDNRISGFMDDPIETQGGRAVVERNLIGIGTNGESLNGGLTGIDVVVGSPANPTLVRDNLIQNATEAGMEMQGANGATVVGNTILNSGFRGGIWVHQAFGTTFSADNVLGGQTAAEENVISGSDGPAIELAEPGDVRNVVGRNTGIGNGGPFIDLGNDGSGNSLTGPNGGIQAPVIADARQSSASGGARPGARVMAFSKASPASGEISGFLGSAVADGSGSWTIHFARSVPIGATFAATQTTDEDGTSELAAAGANADPPDKNPPETVIKRGPKGRSEKHWAKFRFGSDEAGSTFLCRLDAGPFKPCRSPRLYRHLAPGRHVFRVKALDSAGNMDPSAALRRFRVRVFP